MYKVGMSTKGQIFGEELFREYNEAGVSYMELALSADEYDAMDLKVIRAWADRYDVGLWSLHLPFYPFERIDLSSDDISKRKQTIDYLSGIIKKGADVGIDKFVIHPSGEPIGDDEREQRIALVGESLAVLADVADACDAVLAVEDLPRTCLGNNSDEILKLLSYDGRLRVCFDTNHLLKEDPIDFIKKTGRYFVTIHVSDYDFKDEKHWLPGEGLLPWKDIMIALRNVGYEADIGTLMYEVMPDCAQQGVRSRRLKCSDYVRNANELYENAGRSDEDIPLTRI